MTRELNKKSVISKGHKKRLKLVAIVTALAVTFVSLCGFTYYDGLGTAYYETELEVFDDTMYSELITNHSQNGIENAHFLTADTTDGELMPLVFNGEVRGVYTLQSMIEYAKSLGYKTVAAVNGDIYDTSSGTPKGLTIHEGNIVTSGYAPERVVMFNSDGEASVQPVSLTYSLSGTIGYMQAVTVPAETSTSDGNTTPVTEGTATDSAIVTPTPAPAATTQEYVEQPLNTNIDFVNVPYGAAHGLHLYSRHFSSSTRTSGTCAEVVIECDNPQLTIGGTVAGKVVSVNPTTSNTPIGDNQIVLSTISGSASYNYLCAMVVGSQVEITVTDNGSGALEDAKECVGIYYSLVENGKNVTSGTTVNARTALGIKADGSLVLFEVDGKLPNKSTGVGLYDLAETMIDLGCEYAVNLDGGGSSVFYVRKPGLDENATLVSTPSNGTQRKVANAVLLVYKESGSSNATRLSVYPENSYVMPGATVQLKAYGSNEKYEKASLNSTVEYDVNSSYGTIDSTGLFTAGSKDGTATVNAYSGRLSGSTVVSVVEDIQFTPSVSTVSLSGGETKDINVVAKVGEGSVSIPVSSNDNLFTWSCDDSIGTIDANGVFTASSSITGGEGNISITYGNTTQTVKVYVNPGLTVFKDTADHWAKSQIGTLAAMGILSGMGDNLFEPDSSLTRAQFVTMLAKMTTDANVTEATSAGFTDVPEAEWYCSYVNWGYQNGIVSGMGDGTFAPNASITREQMAIMLCNYATSVGFALPISDTEVSFTDYNLISSWAIDYVLTVAKAGIINGFDTGDFQPQGVATRAQAAKVIYMLCSLRGMF